MSDLDPHPRPLVLEDPSVTRLIPRDPARDRCAGLLEQIDDVATSVSVVLPSGGAVGESMVAALSDWTPANLRVEVLVVDDENDPGRSRLREHLARSGRTWRVVERPPGGRAAALAAASVAADHEFMLVGSTSRPDVGMVVGALSLMWAEGADAAIVDPPSRRVDADISVVDPSAALADRLGLSGRAAEGGLVLLRSWVARWLFNEVTRAISPGDEVADRARLLGIGIVALRSAG